MWVNATSSDGITKLREIEIQTNVESQKQAKLQSRTTTSLQAKSKVKRHVLFTENFYGCVNSQFPWLLESMMQILVRRDLHGALDTRLTRDRQRDA